MSTPALLTNTNLRKKSMLVFVNSEFIDIQ